MTVPFKQKTNYVLFAKSLVPELSDSCKFSMKKVFHLNPYAIDFVPSGKLTSIYVNPENDSNYSKCSNIIPPREISNFIKVTYPGNILSTLNPTASVFVPYVSFYNNKHFDEAPSSNMKNSWSIDITTHHCNQDNLDEATKMQFYETLPHTPVLKLPNTILGRGEISNTPILMEGQFLDSTLNPNALEFRSKNNDSFLGPKSDLRQLRLSNIHKVIIGHLNINSLRNKFEMLVDIINGSIDILIVSETKLDDSFPLSQFCIDGYSKPFRMDRTRNGGGLIAFVREDIPCKRLNVTNDDIEAIFFEINFRKRKWLFCGGYNPHNSTISSYVNALGKRLDNFIKSYANLVILGDLNAEADDLHLKTFCETYKCKHLVKVPTCFKNPINPKCIDIILTNRVHQFQNTRVIETGLSDHHKLTLTVLKNEFPKAAPKIIKYRDLANLDNSKFRMDLQLRLSEYDVENMEYSIIDSIFMELTDKHAPVKTKYLRANHTPFMSKLLSQNISHRTKLRNIFLRDPTPFNKCAFKIQRNKCVTILRREKRRYYENLNPKLICDNKKFWKVVKPLFSDKSSCKRKIVLIENSEIINDDQNIAQAFNDLFVNVVERMGMDYDPSPSTVDENTDITIKTILERYSNHPSILQIKESLKIEPNSFKFDKISGVDIQNSIKLIDVSKGGGLNDIPTKLLKLNNDIMSEPISTAYNNSLSSQIFPPKLKKANITPIHKKDESTSKENYRPVSILPVISKIYEKFMFSEIYKYIDQYLSEKICGFRKGFNSQYTLISLIEKWKKAVDNKGVSAALLTDLTKAFDCLNHNLLIAKLHAYGFHDSSLTYILSYLKGRKQRTKVGNAYSSWADILSGVPQGSILGPLLFNIYINDLFLFLDNADIANYADDNTPFACGKNVTEVIVQLQENFRKLSEWSRLNCLKLNNDKSHHLVCNHVGDININAGGNIITCSESEKLLGVHIDNTLKFDVHVAYLCKKANQKLHALARISNFISSSKLITLMKSFVISQFSYCPLVWMFHSKHMNDRINHLHERALRIAYNDYISTFQSLLDRDKSVTIHYRNIQLLAIEMFKLKNGLAPKIMQNLFPLRENQYSLRYCNIFETSNVKTVYHGTETLSFRGPKIWSLVPIDLQNCPSLHIFKIQIKNGNQ